MTKFFFLGLISLVFLCSCSDSDEEFSRASTTSFSPFFEYQIGSDAAIRVNCSEIKFEGNKDYVHTDVIASSLSVNNTFTFNFPSWTSDMDTVKLGNYPILAYQGYAYDIPFHISLKAPKTKGERDYFLSLDASDSSQKNEITKIEKGNIENGLQAYFVGGKFTMKAQNLQSEQATITGSYQFKLLLVVK
jgi:hypothetical protein